MGLVLSTLKNKQIDLFLDSLNEEVDSISIALDEAFAPIIGSGYSNGMIGLPPDKDTVGTPAFFQLTTSPTGEADSAQILSGGNYVLPPAQLANIELSGTGGSGARFNLTTVEKNSYFAFASHVTAQQFPATADPENENPDASFYNPWNEMLFGDKVSFQKVIKRKVWGAFDETYDQYDDKWTNEDLKSKKFYAMNSSGDVFICINNNNGAISTVQPTQGGPVSGQPFKLGDGYSWLYLYNVNSQLDADYGTTSYMPIVQEADVAANAINGAIFNIVVENSGSDYPCHSGVLTETSPGAYKLANGANANTNYYEDSSITAVNGNGLTIVRKIASSNSSLYITTHEPLPNSFFTGTVTYSIGPTIDIIGPSDPGKKALASAVMNEQTGAIQSVNVILEGSGYSSAVIRVTASPGYGSGAELRAIISPRGGHGYDVYEQLYCDTVSARAVFNSAHHSALSYSQIGILHNPLTTLDARFKGNSFDQTTSMTIVDSFISLIKGELVIGQTSGAFGRVAFANTTTLVLSGVSGAFQAGEEIRAETSTASRIITTIDSTPDLKPYSGSVVYIQNLQSEITRSAGNSETVKLILKF